MKLFKKCPFMSALKMLVYILEAETEWFSHRLLMIYKRQQGVTALLLYQAQTATPLQEKT